MPESTSNILLVEDEEAHAELIRRAFEYADNSYRLTVAGSLAEARQALDRQQPNLIIADLQLPDGQGIELLPPEGETQTFPLVVLTAHGDEQIAVEAMKAGALDYVVKSRNILQDIPRVADRALREWRHIIELKRAEEERRKLELRLQHSQRLESLGILAGEIAHDFNNLVVSEMTQLLEAATSKLAVLKLDLTEGVPAVEGAATQIRQIVMNLIMNASDALSGSTGTITVATGLLDADEDYLSTAYLNDSLIPGSDVYVEVADTGCGMDEATQKRLFDPFFTTKTSGRGLGMAAVKGILRSHKGALKLVSQVGRGTTFRILFPASDLPLPGRPDERPDQAAAEPSPRLGGATTVLVVDDDITVRAVTTITLEGAGYLVVAAEDGRQAITKYQQHHDELAAVLFDISMPELSGDQAFRELRQLGAEVPIIISSGSSEEEARDLVPGLSGFIQKPYKAEDLIAKVREVEVLHSHPSAETVSVE